MRAGRTVLRPRSVLSSARVESEPVQMTFLVISQSIVGMNFLIVKWLYLIRLQIVLSDRFVQCCNDPASLAASTESRCSVYLRLLMSSTCRIASHRPPIRHIYAFLAFLFFLLISSIFREGGRLCFNLSALSVFASSRVNVYRNLWARILNLIAFCPGFEDFLIRAEVASFLRAISRNCLMSVTSRGMVAVCDWYGFRVGQ